MSPLALLLIYSAVVVIVSLAGGWLPLLVRLTHKRMEVALSFVAGAMLGVALLHLLPHAFIARLEALGEHVHGAAAGHELIDPIIAWLLAGFLAMFAIERLFRFHHHEAPEQLSASASANDAQARVHSKHHRHELTWTGASIGLSLHGLIDGVALAAALAATAGEADTGAAAGGAGGAGGALAGFGTFLVICLHKPFDSMTLGTLMAVSDRPRATRHLANGLFSLTVPLGAILFHLGLAGDGEASGLAISAALAFSTGTFLCISLSDLLPELQFHQHDRFKLSAALVLGLALAWATTLFDPHKHEHGEDEEIHHSEHGEGRERS